MRPLESEERAKRGEIGCRGKSWMWTRGREELSRGEWNGGGGRAPKAKCKGTSRKRVWSSGRNLFGDLDPTMRFTWKNNQWVNLINKNCCGVWGRGTCLESQNLGCLGHFKADLDYIRSFSLAWATYWIPLSKKQASKHRGHTRTPDQCLAWLSSRGFLWHLMGTDTETHAQTIGGARRTPRKRGRKSVAYVRPEREVVLFQKVVSVGSRWQECSDVETSVDVQWVLRRHQENSRS